MAPNQALQIRQQGSDRLLKLQISVMRAMKVVRRAQHYLQYEFRDIAWPRSLPDPPGYDPANKPWTWKQWRQAIQYANERYRESWTREQVAENPAPQQEGAAGSGLKEELMATARAGKEGLRPTLQSLYQTRAQGYKDALQAFIEGYREGYIGESTARMQRESQDIMQQAAQEPATQIQRAAAEEIRRRREQRAAEAQSQGPGAADRLPHSVVPGDSRRVQGTAGPSGSQEGLAPWAGSPRALSSDARRQRQEANAVGAEVVAEETSGAQHQKRPGNSKSDAAARHERDGDTRTEIQESQTVEHRPAGSNFEPSASQETHSQDRGDHVESTTTKVQTEQEGDSVKEVTTRVKVSKWKSDMLNAE